MTIKPKLETTKNHAQFTFHAEQRPINSGHVKKLIDSMKAHGFLPSKPVQCIRTTKGLQVIDGHHRLTAAQMLDLPIYYVVEETETANTISDVNNAVRCWKLTDYINSFIVKGNKEYVTLQKFIDRGLPASMAISLLLGNSSHCSRGNLLVKMGKFKVVTTMQAEQLMKVIESLRDSLPHVTNHAFIGALGLAWPLKEFDIEAFGAKLRANQSMLPRCSNVEDYLRAIEDIHNFRQHGRIPLAFMAREAAKERSGKAMDKYNRSKRN